MNIVCKVVCVSILKFKRLPSLTFIIILVRKQKSGWGRGRFQNCYQNPVIVIDFFSALIYFVHFKNEFTERTSFGTHPPPHDAAQRYALSEFAFKLSSIESLSFTTKTVAYDVHNWTW